MSETLVASLRDALRAGPPVRVAFLFGSTARGTARADSDVDVAFVPVDPGLSLAEEHAIAERLERAVGRPVDLVRLDGATRTLAWRVARDGVVLASDPPHAAPRWQAEVAIDHDANLELEQEAERRYRAALARRVSGRP